jgi:hypothetical protein
MTPKAVFWSRPCVHGGRHRQNVAETARFPARYQPATRLGAVSSGWLIPTPRADGGLSASWPCDRAGRRLPPIWPPRMPSPTALDNQFPKGAPSSLGCIISRQPPDKGAPRQRHKASAVKSQHRRDIQGPAIAPGLGPFGRRLF